jgi:hypothetical protein
MSKILNNALCVIKLFLKSVMKFSGGAKLRVVTSHIAFKNWLQRWYSQGVLRISYDHSQDMNVILQKDCIVLGLLIVV